MPQYLPPARVVRVLERARHHLDRLHSRTMPASVALMEMVMNAWVAQAITAAAQLGIADALAAGPLTADQLAAAVDADAAAVGRLMRALISRGIFRQCRDGRYALTALAQPLRTDAEISLNGWIRYAGSSELRARWSDLSDGIRAGHCVAEEMRGRHLFDYLAANPDLHEVFNEAMTGVSETSIAPLLAAYDFSRYPVIADVGGGHGRFLAAILSAAPATRGVLFDLPDVVAGAPGELAEHGVAERVRIVEGSFFDDPIPGDCDAYVVKNVLHDWPDADALRILSNMRAAMPAGRHLLLIELLIPPHNRESPGKWLDLDMFLSTGTRLRTVAEYESMLVRAGFRLRRVVETVSPFSVLEAEAV